MLYPEDEILPLSAIEHLREKHPARFRQRLAALGVSDSTEGPEALAICTDVGSEIVRMWRAKEQAHTR